jgi:hypothetical protein
MAEIVKVYKQNVGNLKFIGKRYGDSDRVNGNFGAKWGEWFQNGWFDVVAKQIDGSLKDIYEDGEAQIGLMREKEGVFEYWIGYFMPENTAVPEGFEYIDFPASNFGICWVYGKEEEIYFNEGKCGTRLGDDGFTVINDWCFERYACPRFTTPDEKGNIILDIVPCKV